MVNTDIGPRRIRTDAIIPPGGGQPTGQTPVRLQRISTRSRKGFTHRCQSGLHHSPARTGEAPAERLLLENGLYLTGASRVSTRACGCCAVMLRSFAVVAVIGSSS